jgi:hypothetical protein
MFVGSQPERREHRFGCGKINLGAVNQSIQHFFKSPVSGLGGPSEPLRKALEGAGIGYVIH